MLPTIGSKIKSIRQSFSLSQTRFGYKIGLSGKTISSYENGRSVPPIKILNKIAEVYGVSFSNISTKNRKTIKYKINAIEKQILKLKEILNSEILTL